MSSGDWWTDPAVDAGDYNPSQTSSGPELLNPNTVYSPPGEAAPIDQYNYVPDPNSPGGYQTYGPGQVAPVEQPAFSNTSGEYPNDQDMANALANNIDLTPSVDQAGNAAFMDQYNQMNAADQAVWANTYGPNAAPYIWAQQTGAMPGASAGFNALPPDQQNIWYGTYGAQAPQIWAQQSAQAAAGQQVPGPSPYLASQGNYANGSTVPWNNPWSIGAGTSSVPYGWGVPGFGQQPIDIRPEYMDYLNRMTTGQVGGYIPGSGTFNQYPLDQPGLLTNINGQMVNARYGQGGTGDPTTGREVQTPQEWVQGDKLFNSTVTSNWGQTDETRGKDYIANLFLRSDTASGIGTPTWSAPEAYWQGLAGEIAAGRIQPTARGWDLLNQRGYTPEKIGGAAPQQAAAARAAGGGTGPMGRGTQAFNYQAAYLDYLTARMNQLEIPGMQNVDERERDRLAFEQAKQQWLQGYQEQQAQEAQRQFNALQGVREGQLTGTFNGQQTLAAQAQQQDTSLRYLNLLAQLRGPGDIFQYLKVLNGTPGGIRDIVNAAAGAYRMPTSSGAQVGGYSNPVDVNTLLSQINNPNYGQEGQNLNLPLPNQINALALQRMTPSQQQSLVAAYENAGYNPNDVLAIFRNSMPQYATQGGAGRVNLLGR